MEAHENKHDDQAGRIEEWSLEKKAFAVQWLIEKRLEALRRKMPPKVFIEVAGAVDLLLAAWESAAE
jgi:hypothetical protein